MMSCILDISVQEIVLNKKLQYHGWKTHSKLTNYKYKLNNVSDYPENGLGWMESVLIFISNLWVCCEWGFSWPYHLNNC